MSLRLALELSDRIAAVAPVVAAMPSSSGCKPPKHPISILFMNGTDDPILPYAGGEVAPDIGGRGSVLSTRASVAYWTDFDRTGSTPEVVVYPDINRTDLTSVRRTTYTGGLEDTQVVLYEVIKGGHLEPSMEEQYSVIAEAYLGRQNHDIEMAREIWDFLKNKRL
jgi:polyhydroxybutyrate depolymerase